MVAAKLFLLLMGLFKYFSLSRLDESISKTSFNEMLDARKFTSSKCMQTKFLKIQMKH